MATSIFDEKAIIPEDSMIIEALADKKHLWDKLENHLFENFEGMKKDWKFYSKKSGWTLVFKKKERTLLYFIPCEDYFKVTFVFGKNAIEAAKQAALPETIIEAILTATSYAEGTSFFVDVKNDEDLEIVIKLLKIKVEF